MASKNAKDHWAFLEEIEAPMWVDLAQEADYSDSDDQWFQISHQFHQLSSKQLKAAFRHCSNEEFGLVGQSSPQLPSSVSRSRGKHLAGKKFQKGSHDLVMNKQHPVKALRGKSSLVNSVLDDVRKPKISVVKSGGTSNSLVNSASESASTGCIKEGNTLPLGNGQHSKDGSSSGDRAGESNTSTLTSETFQQPHRRHHESFSQALGNKSSILAEVRISLRKSCVRRQAARVETNNGSIQTTNRWSLSNKSGVGSSLNPGFNLNSEKSCRPSSGKSSWGSSSNSSSDVIGNRVRKSSSAKSSVGSSSVNPGDDVKDSEVCKSSSDKSTVGSSSNPCTYNESKPKRRSSSGMSSTESSSKPCPYVKSKPNFRSLSSKPGISSSSNPGADVKFSGIPLLRGKEWTSDSRNVASNGMAAIKKVQGSRILRDSSNIQLKDGPRNTRLVNKVNLEKSSAYPQHTKGKALIQTAPMETLQLHRVNGKGLLIGAAATHQKLGIAGANRLVGTGKENDKARTCRKPKGSVVECGVLMTGQSKKPLNPTRKGDITSLDNPKGKPCNHPIMGKQRPVATTQKLHFR
ncbi:unnamed protein product [Linum tenue]|uniref:Uncharacterized protein n=1 Tax=Linum tenue TaxID=586396 RepID=A0AAV0GS11_9ROSI|nr:unnamed protein product [Linum tenue]